MFKHFTGLTLFIEHFENKGHTVATSPVMLRWLCDSPRTGCAWRITPFCMLREQATIEWSRRVISIVACCHGAKLCAYAARDFRLQHCSPDPVQSKSSLMLISAAWHVFPILHFEANFLFPYVSTHSGATGRYQRWADIDIFTPDPFLKNFCISNPYPKISEIQYPISIPIRLRHWLITKHRQWS